MAKKDPKVAKRYARALFYVVPQERYEICQRAVNELTVCWKENSELRQALENPSVSAQDRERVLQELCSRISPGDEQFIGFARLLLRNDRLNVLSDVNAAFADLVRAARNIVAIDVTSAFQLSEEERTAVQRRLEEQLHKAVSIRWSVDPEILGGLILKSADRLIDGSVRGTLERLGNSLAAH